MNSLRIFERLTAPRMGLKERAALAKRLSFLARSGMPLTEALAILAANMRSSRVRSALMRIASDIEAGKPFAESAGKFRGLFSPFAVQVIAVGEASGTLAENLGYLADEMRKAAMLRARLLGSLVYPAVITLATIALTVSLVVFIFPKILPVFSGLRVSLPLSTRLLLAVSRFLKRNGLALLAALIIGVLGFLYALRFEVVRTSAEHIAFSLPIIGPLLVAYRIGHAARTLALLLESGMTLRDAIPATARAAGSVVYRRAFELLAARVEEGEGLSPSLRANPALFPDLTWQMIAVGESSGSLSSALRYLSDYYEGEFDEEVKRLSALVEPVLMILMGGIVGFVAVSMIAPIYEVTEHLHAN